MQHLSAEIIYKFFNNILKELRSKMRNETLIQTKFILKDRGKITLHYLILSDTGGNFGIKVISESSNDDNGIYQSGGSSNTSKTNHNENEVFPINAEKQKISDIINTLADNLVFPVHLREILEENFDV
jgi:hypothetical protein